MIDISEHGGNYDGGQKLNFPKGTYNVAENNTIKAGDLVDFRNGVVNLYEHNQYTTTIPSNNPIVDSITIVVYDCVYFNNGNIAVMYGYNYAFYMMLVKINSDGTVTKGIPISLPVNGQITGTNSGILGKLSENEIVFMHTVQNVGTYGRLIKVDGLAASLGNELLLFPFSSSYMKTHKLNNDRLLATVVTDGPYAAIIKSDGTNLLLLKASSKITTGASIFPSALDERTFFFLAGKKISKVTVNDDNSFTIINGTGTLNYNYAEVAVVPINHTKLALYFNDPSNSALYFKKAYVEVNQNMDPVLQGIEEVLYAKKTRNIFFASRGLHENIHFISISIDNGYEYFFCEKENEQINDQYSKRVTFHHYNRPFVGAEDIVYVYTVQNPSNSKQNLNIGLVEEKRPFGIAKTAGIHGQEIKVYKL